MSPSNFFEQPTLESPTTFDVDFESMDSYFIAFNWHIIKLSVGSSAFFASCTCLSTGRWSGGHKQTWCICDYIGLENSILGARKLRFFLREQSRTRKYKQHVSQQLAFFEPAIKLWCKRDNFYQFCIFPLRSQCGDAEHRLSLEQALQQTLRPIYNWPWINPLLKRWRIGKDTFWFHIG